MGSEIAREDYTKPVRIGAVGVRGRGGGLLRMLAGMEVIEIPAICDVNPEIVEAIQNMVIKEGDVQFKQDALHHERCSGF